MVKGRVSFNALQPVIWGFLLKHLAGQKDQNQEGPHQHLWTQKGWNSLEPGTFRATVLLCGASRENSHMARLTCLLLRWPQEGLVHARSPSCYFFRGQML